MTEQNKIKNCIKCGKGVNENYCANCGHPKALRRIDKQYIISEIGSVLNFDKGIFYTIKELLIRPGKIVREFILEDRNRLVKPLIFILISSLIFTIIKQLFPFEDGYVSYSNSKQTAVTAVFEWVQNNYGYANILMGSFIAIWIKILFRKYDYNFYEILILLCFVMGVGMLIYSVFGIIETLTSLKVMQAAGMISLVYITWAIGQFFDRKKYMNYLKAFVSYFLGVLTFIIGVFLLGFLIDLVL